MGIRTTPMEIGGPLAGIGRAPIRISGMPIEVGEAPVVIRETPIRTGGLRTGVGGVLMVIGGALIGIGVASMKSGVARISIGGAPVEIGAAMTGIGRSWERPGPVTASACRALTRPAGRARLAFEESKMALLPKHEGLITAEELAHLPDLGPCELVHGRIVPLSPAQPLHGYYEGTIGVPLANYARASGRGRALFGEVGIRTRRGPDTVRGADFAFISHERWARRNPKGFLDVPPELVVEILSPDDRRGEVMEKLEEYLAMGVDLVWIVDPEHRYVLAYRSQLDVERFDEGDSLIDEEVLPGFSLPVADIFR